MLDGTNFFAVPEYQRLYRWTKTQCDDLFEDIRGHLNSHDGVNIENVPEYFLGSIVVVEPPQGAQAFSVIDGQQRLTTLTMLYSALHHLEDWGDMRTALADRLRSAGDAAMGIAPSPRLRIRAQMQDIFEPIQNVGEDDAGRGIRDNFFDADITTHGFLNREPTEVEEQVRKNALHLHALASDLEPDFRRRFIQFLTTRCIVVLAGTDNRDSAMIIFRL